MKRYLRSGNFADWKLKLEKVILMFRGNDKEQKYALKQLGILRKHFVNQCVLCPFNYWNV
jgi:hypothetical protein